MLPFELWAQSITGSTSVIAGVQAEYSVNYTGVRVSWDAGTGGTVHDTWVSNGKNYSKVSWSTPGSKTLEFKQSGSVIASLSVTAAAPALYPGSISGSQAVCESGDPSQLSSTQDASGGLGTRQYQWQQKTSRTSYSNISGATSAAYNPPTLSTTTTFRRRVQDDYSTEYTDEVVVTVYHVIGGSISGTETICYNGNPDKITNSQNAAGGDGSYAYHWEVSTDNVNWSVISGATNATYNPGNLTTTTSYKRGATSANCDIAYSNTVTKTVLPAINPGEINSQDAICYETDPAKITNKTSPSGGTGVYTYQWQRYVNNTWTDISGATGLEYDPSLDLTADRYYRRVVTSENCGSANTPPVLIEVAPALQGGTISDDQTICFGTIPSKLLNEGGASGGNGAIAYQWEYSTATVAWTEIEGATAKGYSPGELFQTTSFRRMAYSESCGSVASNTVEVTVRGKLGPGTITGDQTICHGGDPATITAGQAPVGGDNENYDYSWQFSTDGNSWTDIEIEGPVVPNWYNPPAGLTETTMYRRGVESADCEVRYTTPVTVTVSDELTPGEIAGVQEICDGTDAGMLSSVSLPQGGEGPSSYQYTWQVSPNNADWEDVAGAGETLDPTDVLYADRWYRRMVTSGACGTAATSSVKVTVADPVDGGAISEAQTICFGAIPERLVNAGGATGGIGAFTYQWESSTDNINWSEISGEVGKGFSPGELFQTTYFRRRADSESCESDESNVIEITVLGKLGPGTISGDQTICYEGDPAIITAGQAPVGGDDVNYDYSWQYSTDLTTWTDIVIEEPVTPNWYNPPAGLTQTTYYRRGVISGGCAIRYTAPVTVTVLDELTPGAIGGVQTICDATDAGLISSVSLPQGGEGPSSYQYTWQVSPNDTDWEVVAGSEESLDPPDILYADRWYRRVVTSGSCGTAETNSVKVTVADPVEGGSISDAQTICFGSVPERLLNTEGGSGGIGPITYQWEFSVDNVNWEAIAGEVGKGYSPDTLYQTTWFRRRADSEQCESDESNEIKITVYGKLIPGTISGDQLIEWNSTPEALIGTEATGSAGEPRYQWQESADGESWTDITGSTGTHHYFAEPLKSSMYYRRYAYTDLCPPTTLRVTNEVFVEVDALVLTFNGPLASDDYSHGGTIDISWSANATELGGYSLKLVKGFEATSQDAYTSDYEERIPTTPHSLSSTMPPGGDYQVLIEVDQMRFLSEEFVVRDPVDHALVQPVEVERLMPGQSGQLAWTNHYDYPYAYKVQLESQSGERVTLASQLSGGSVGTTTESTWEAPRVDPGIYQLIVSEENGWIINSAEVEILPERNYVKAYIARQPLQGTITDVKDPYQVQQSITYFDGLGRPVQSVGIEASPAPATDLVTPITYDSYGRQNINYLPFAETTSDGQFHEDAIVAQAGYYEQAYPGDGNAAFSQTVFESSPLNRVLSQAAPGQAWKVGSGHTVDSRYEVNGENEVRMLTVVDDHISVNSGYYTVGKLYKNAVLDENNGAAEGETIEYSNISGQVVMKKVKLSEATDGSKTYAQTYYLYDEYDNLRHVVQPEGIRKIEAGEDNMTWDSLASEGFQSRWMFSYEYDHRQRMIAKHVPGALWTRMVYDDQDRLVLTQDGMMRSQPSPPDHYEILTDDHEANGVQTTSAHYFIETPGSMTFTEGFEVDGATVQDFEVTTEAQLETEFFGNNWQFTKYDHLNRPVLTGIAVIEKESSIEDELARHYEGAGSSTTEDYTGDGPLEGYTDAAFPSVNPDELLTVTYYDNYDFYDAAAFGQSLESLKHPDATDRVRGLVTGTKTRVLDTDQWITTITFYDDRNRVLKTVASNYLDDQELDGKDIVENEYRNKVSPLVVQTVRTHTDGNGGSVTIADEFTYDHGDRVLTQTQRIDGANPTVIASNSYDSLGQLITKDIGDGLQSVDYQYNIRGWLRSINGGFEDFDDATDKFGMELNYFDTDEEHQAYNGNIGRLAWRSVGGREQGSQKYLYKYDAASRIKNAYYYNNDDPGMNNLYQVAGLVVEGVDQGIAYDANGNIEALRRRGPDPTTGNRVYLDDLTYGYDGNRLDNVADARGDDLFGEQYSDGANAGEYQYDDNGNMIVDANKGLEVTYNHLNLPEMVTFTHEAGKYVKYTYDAAGVKLRKESVSDEASEVVDYVGGIHYKNGALEFMQHAEGRTVKESEGFFYEYNLTDHLGNVRVVVAEPEVIEYLATMETENAEYDEGVFANVAATRWPGANHTPNGNESSRVSNRQPIGPWTTLNVAAGDTVDISVFAYYEPGTPTADPAALAAGLAAAASAINAPSTSLEGISQSQLSFEQAVGTGVVIGEANGEVPQGYLNYLLFDEDMNLEVGGFVQVSESASGALEELSISSIIPRTAGKLYVYVSNQTDTTNFENFVHFDDLHITHKTNGVKQVQDYYPFGLTFNEWTRAPENLYKYNNVEKDNTTGNYETLFRGYDPSLGKFTQVDPLTSFIPSLSAYHFGFNNPIFFNDPLGLMGNCPTCPRSSMKDKADEFMHNSMMTGDGNVASEDIYTVDSEGNKILNSDIAGTFTLSPYGTRTYSQERLVKDEVEGYHLISQNGGMTDFTRSNWALTIGGGIYGAMEGATAGKGHWLGKNGKYYTNMTGKGPNQWTGSRAAALKSANTYRLAGRGVIVVSAGIGIYSTIEGYQMDGGEFGYNAQKAAATSTGGIVGGIAGAKIGAGIGAGIGVWFGGVGAVPGAVIGGFIGGIAGSFTGSYAGEAAVNYYHDR